MAATGGIVSNRGMRSDRGDVTVVADREHVVLRGWGEHDLSTAALVSAAFIEAGSIGELDVVVDLSDVTFMDCSTVRVLVSGRLMLTGRNRSLSIRGASARQRWFLELCGLADLLEDIPDGTDAQVHGASTALESWVAVPAAVRVVEATSPPVEGDFVQTKPEGARK